VTLRFLTDENVPSSVRSWLKRRDHDTKGTVEALHPGATDMAIARYAHREGRMVISLDQDFIRLHRQLKTKFGVVIIRSHPPTTTRVQECIERLLARVDITKHPDALIVVTEREIRIEAT
jgi:predicted nuclease of predicted toxin-antitoxin system